MLDRYLNRIKLVNRDVRLFRKIMGLLHPIPRPGDLQNLIRTAVAFSDPGDGSDYLRRLYSSIVKSNYANESTLKSQGFTVREIAVLTNRSKSDIGRMLIKEH